MKLTRIYTRTGDTGMTSLVGGQRTRKDSLRLEAYGTLDELSSHLGLLAASLGQNDGTAETEQAIERIQCNIFNICTFLATDTSVTPVYPSARLAEEEVTTLERLIDTTNATLPPLDSFILPAGSPAAAQCHVCRTVCRRAERRVITLYTEVFPDLDRKEDEACRQAATILHYINRLSDYLFVLSRKLNIISGIGEKIWQNTCK